MPEDTLRITVGHSPEGGILRQVVTQIGEDKRVRRA